ncbi:DUF3221 domain-containing protein [Alkalicoccus urumqiensis]|nr:DUF3221 domain-containing protein [Alkalicoccus urumqiensis]
MKGWILLGTGIVLAGCSSEGEAGPPSHTGYVTEIDGDRMLVVEEEPEDYSDTGGLETFYDAIWFEGTPEELLPGDFVHVWAEGAIAESYPGQGTAERASIIQPEEYSGAELDEQQALELALEETADDDASTHYAVEDVTFEEGLWTVTLYDSIAQRSIEWEFEE